MSLPSYINVHDDNFYSLENIVSDLDTLYLQSLKDTEGLSDKNQLLPIHNDTPKSLFSAYASLVDMTNDTYKEVRDDSIAKDWSQLNQTTKSIKESSKEYHLRNAIRVNNYLESRAETTFSINECNYISTYIYYIQIQISFLEFGQYSDYIKNIALNTWNFEQLPGINPGKWPQGLEDLKQKLQALPVLSLFNEPLELNEKFKIATNEFIQQQVQTLKQNENDEISLSNLINSLSTYLLLTLHTGTFAETLKIVLLVNSVHESLQTISRKLAEKVYENIESALQRVIELAAKTEHIHGLRNISDQGGFKINKFQHFQKQTYSNTSITTDGAYLYIYISAVNGGMYKIGLGEKGTIAGKVYLYVSLQRQQEEICWVFLKGKLYLRNSSKEFGTLDIICPKTFKNEGFLQLYCPDIFSHPSLQIVNKNYPLITDGQYLYVIGKKLVSEKIQNPKDDEKKTEEKKDPENAQTKDETKKEQKEILPKESEIATNEKEKQSEKDVPTKEQEVKDQNTETKEKKYVPKTTLVKKGKREPEKKRRESSAQDQEDQTLKLIEYILYEFDITDTRGQDVGTDYGNQDNSLIQELFESFNGFFTFAECARALNFNKDDIQTAAQWLVDEGEKERTKKTVLVRNQTILAQAEVISDISHKNLKNNADIATKEDSVIFPSHVSFNIWTINDKYVALYSETGVKIFSKNPEHEGPLKSNNTILYSENLFGKTKTDKSTELKSDEQIKVQSEQTKETQTQQESTEATTADKKQQQPKRVELKGTFLGTLDICKKTYYMHNNLHIVYDSYNMKYYIFNWIWNQFTNVFPSLITVSFDSLSYEKGEIHNNIAQNVIQLNFEKPRNLKEIGQYLLRCLVNIQSKRFNLPWKFRRWDFTYETVIYDLYNKKAAQSGSQTEEEKKKFNTQKNKILQRLNKYLEYKRNLKSESQVIDSERNPNQTWLVEIKKDFAFCIEGSGQSLNLIYQQLKEAFQKLVQGTECNSTDLIYLHFLYLWGKHADILIADPAQEFNSIQILDDIEQTIYQILTSQNFLEKLGEKEQFRKIQSELWRFVIYNWNVLLRKSEKQLQWLDLAIQHTSKYYKICKFELEINEENDEFDLSQKDIDKEGFSPLGYLYIKLSMNPSTIHSSFPLKEYVIYNIQEKNRNYNKVDGATNFIDHFKKYEITKINEKSFSQSFSRVVIGDINYLAIANPSESAYEELFNQEFILKKGDKEKFIQPEFIEKYKQFNSKFSLLIENALTDIDLLQKPDILCLMRYLYIAYTEAWIEITKIQDTEKEIEYKQVLLKQITKILKLYTEQNNKILPKLRGKFYQLIAQLATTTGYFIYQSYLGYSQSSTQLFTQLIEICSIIKKTLTTSTGKQLLNVPLTLVREGIDQFEEKIFETNHPYERGKVQSFDTCTFPGAVAIAVEFDKRCQSDASQDFLVLIAWYENHSSHSGYYGSFRDSMSNCYRVSGKPSHKRPLLLLGNVLQVEFTSSGQARDEHSLNRWGYKLRVKPIYGLNSIQINWKSPDSEFNEIYEKFENKNTLIEYINGLCTISVALTDIASNYLLGSQKSKEEIESEEFLHWSLIKKGLAVQPESKDFKLDINQLFTAQDKATKLRQDLIKKLMKQKRSTTSKTIINKQVQEQNQNKENQFKNLEPSLKVFVDQVQQKEGKIMEIIDKVKKLEKEPQTLTIEKRRKTFTGELQKLWQEVENFIVLTYLYHTELLNLPFDKILGESKQEKQLITIAKKKNEVLRWELTQIQAEREYQQTILDILDNLNKQIALKQVQQSEDIPKPKNEQQKKDNTEQKSNKVTHNTGKRLKRSEIGKLTKSQTQQKKSVQIEKEEEKAHEEIEEEHKIPNEEKISPPPSLKTQERKIDYSTEITEAGDQEVYNIYRSRFEGNADTLRTLCVFNNLKFDSNDLEESTKVLYNHCKSVIFKFSRDEKTKQFIPDLLSPYQIRAEIILNKCIFLLKVSTKSKPTPYQQQFLSLSHTINILGDSLNHEKMSLEPNNSKQQLNGEDFEVLTLSLQKSTSTTFNEKDINDDLQKERLHNLRKMIDSYQKWREWEKSEGKSEEQLLYSENVIPIEALTLFFKAKPNIKSLEQSLENQSKRYQSRINGLNLFIDICQFIKVSQLDIYIQGSLAEVFYNSVLDDVECVDYQLKEVLAEKAARYMQIIMTNFNYRWKNDFGVCLDLVNSSSSNKTSLNNRYQNMEKSLNYLFKGPLLYLSDLKILVQTPLVLQKIEEQELIEFFQSALKLGLICYSFQYLSQNYETLVNISQNYIKMLQVFCFNLFKQQRYIPGLLRSIVNLLYDELGFKKDRLTINVRILHRCNDPSVIDRIFFLLLLQYDLIFENPNAILKESQQPLIQNLSSQLIFLLYQHKAPKIVRGVTKILKLVLPFAKLHQLISPYDLTYRQTYLENIDELIKNPKQIQSLDITKFKWNDTKFDQPQSNLQVESVGLSSLIEKLGTLISVNKGESKEAVHKDIIDNQQIVLQKSFDNNKSTLVLVHLTNEEDITFLLKVLYYWEELHPSFTLKYPKTADEFKVYKETKVKKESENRSPAEKNQQSQQSQNTNTSNISQKAYEKLILNLPELNFISEDEEDLPVGYFLNYLGNFNDFKKNLLEPRRGKVKKIVKKVWSTSAIQKLEKKYEDFLKTTEDFKEEDTDEIKAEIIKAKNFATRMLHHLKDIHSTSSLLNVFGFAPIGECMSQENAQELSHLIQLGIKGHLKSLPVENLFTKEDFKKKLDPAQILQTGSSSTQNNAQAQPTTTKSTMIVSICEFSVYQLFDTMVDFVTSLTPGKDSFYIDANKITVIHKSLETGASTNSVISMLIGLFRHLINDDNCKEQIIQYCVKSLDVLANSNWQDLSNYDRKIILGATSILSDWSDAVTTGVIAKIKGLEQEGFFAVVQSGKQSGKKDCQLVSIQDPKLMKHKVSREKVQVFQRNLLNINELGLSLKNLIISFNKLYNLYTIQNQSDNQNEFIAISSQFRILLKIIIESDWNKILREDTLEKDVINEFMHNTLALCKQCPVDKSLQYYENIFAEAWQNLVLKMQPRVHLFYSPKYYASNKQYDFEDQITKTRKYSEIAINTQEKETVDGYNLTQSPYVSSLPEVEQTVSEHKMLKYWEKYIIPKLQDFVRSSLKPFEFDDFFEQIRQPLRKGDQTRAAEVAYIICDQRLPAGVTLPDANHDWSSISIEECYIGQQVIARISSRSTENLLYTPFLQGAYDRDCKDIFAQIIGIDSRSSSVLVIFQDDETLQMLTCWLPCVCLKIPEIALSPNAASFSLEDVQKKYRMSAENSISILTRQALLSFFSFNPENVEDIIKESKLISTLNFSVIDIIKWSVLQELADRPVDGWLDVQGSQISQNLSGVNQENDTIYDLIRQYNNGKLNINVSSNSYPKLQQLQQFLNWAAKDQQSTLDLTNILNWLKNSIKNIGKFIAKYQGSLNLKKGINTETLPSKLHLGAQIYPLNLQLYSQEEKTDNEDTSGAIVIVFKNDAKICPCAGVKFYSDPLGINNLHQISTGKDTKSKIPPIVFQQSNVYYQYYFNAEALPPMLQGQVNSDLPCIAYCIPSNWSVTCWLIDAVTTALMLANNSSSLEQMSQLSTQVQELLLELQGPNAIREILIILQKRIINKIRYILNKVSFLKNEESYFSQIGFTKAKVEQLIEEAQKLKTVQDQQEITLYSSYIQNISELIAIILTPIVQKESTIQPILNLNISCPDWIRSIVNIYILALYFKKDSQLPESMSKEFLNQLKIDQQWEQIICVKGLPTDWEEEKCREVIQKIIQENKGRILNPIQDLIFPLNNGKPVGICVIILDDWAVLDFSDTEEKPPAEEEVKIPEEQQEEPEWECQTCTLLNSPDLPICQVCETPKPVIIKPQVEEIKHTDLNELEKEIQRKNKEHLEKLIKELNEKVNQYYEEQANKQAEEIKKIKEEQKNQQNQQQSLDETKTESTNQQIFDSEEKEKKRLENRRRKELKRNKQKALRGDQQALKNLQIGLDKSEQSEIQQQKEAGTEKKVSEKTEELKNEGEQPKEEIKETNETKETIISETKISNCQVFSGNTIENDQICFEFVKNVLAQRLLNPEASQLREPVVKIFKNYFKNQQLILQEALKNEKITSNLDNEETLIEELFNQAKNDPKSIWKVLEGLGYDLWLNHSHFTKKPDVKFSFKAIEQLMLFIEKDLCQETKSVLFYLPTNIRITTRQGLEGQQTKPINYEDDSHFNSNFQALAKHSLRDIRWGWAIIKAFNKNLSDALPFINLNTEGHFDFDAVWLNLATYLSAMRTLWMSPIKIELHQRALQTTAIQRENVPKVTVERLKISKELVQSEYSEASNNLKKDRATVIDKEEENQNGLKTDFAFIKAYDQLKNIHSTLLRPVKPQGSDPFLSFEVIFKGEHVMGEAGPYRQFFADISSELQPAIFQQNTKRLNLLCPSPNNAAKIGEGRDKFLINPSSKSSYDLHLYEFLGLLMGCCIRTGTHLTLDLPQIFWKQLIGQNITLEDLEIIDKGLCELFNFLSNCSKEEFEESLFETFTTPLSDRSVVELIPLGSQKKVTFENRFEYMRLVFQARLNENAIQIEAIRKGILKLIPKPFLNCLSAENIEIWVCGKAKVDFNLLKRHTKYSGGLDENSRRVLFLWQVLDSLKENEKLRFVKFCWGQERLPANDEEFDRTQTRFMIKPATYSVNNPDKALPKADTCFFNLELPDYSTYDIARERLLLAINTDCDSMNAEEPINLDPNQAERRDSSFEDEQYY